MWARKERRTRKQIQTNRISTRSTSSLTHSVWDPLTHPHLRGESLTSLSTNRTISCSVIDAVDAAFRGAGEDGVTPLPQDSSLSEGDFLRMSSTLPTMWLGARNGW